MDAQPPESKPCPDGDKVPVMYVYLGVNLSGKIGVAVHPDSITMNGFTAANNAFSAAQSVTLTHARATTEIRT